MSELPNRSDVVTRVHQQFPQLLQANTHEKDVEFLQRVIEAMPEEWGHLSKESGENGFTFTTGKRVSHDAICHKASDRLVDVIGGAGSGSPASPTWNPIDPALRRPHNVFVSLSAVPRLPDGPPPDVPAWEVKHQQLLAQLPTVLNAQQIATQFAAAFPDEVWGAKRASQERPISDDVIARRTQHGLFGYQVVPRTSSPQTHNLAGQVFVPVGTPGPVRPIEPKEMLDEALFLDNYYKSPEGLRRPQGLSINNAPDWQGVGAWLFDAYLSSRLAGKTREQARAEYVTTIRQSAEWRQKHPGETP